MYVSKSLVIALIEFALETSKATQFIEKCALHNAPDTVSVSRYNQIWQELLELTQDTFLGWKCGHQFDVLSTGLLGYIIRHSPDVRTALIKITQYSRLLSNLVSYEVKPVGPHIEVIFSPTLAWEQQSTQVVQQEVERIMAFMIQGLATLTGKPFHPVTIQLKRKSPEVIPAFFAQLTDHFVYNTSLNAFVFAAEVLQLPLIHRNHQLLHTLESHARQMLDQLQVETFTDKVRQKMVSYFQQYQHFCQIEWVADEFNLGVRTFQRKLKAENRSFTAIADEVKLSFAKVYLNDTQLSIHEVAFLLGYNEISAFYHFFKKHTSLTPRDFRIQAK